MKPPRVLIIEDEHALALALAAAVRQGGASSELAPTATQGRNLLESGRRFDAMVLDIGLPDENGLDFLASVDAGLRPPTVVVTAHGEIQNTIAARKLGVVDFLTKPLDFDEFQSSLRRLFEPRRPEPEPVEPAGEGAPFIGAAAAMRPVFQQIAHSCASDDPVLVRGETGTGKSHAAHLIQGHGVRQGPARVLPAGPATTTGELTGALQNASGGGLILEEVGLLAPDAQAELVRQIEAAAGEGLPRLIATTSEDLRARVSDGLFRSDLFYRLQVLEVRLPPLRERMDDLPALVSYFIGQLAPERSIGITDAALACLGNHDWPGNLRELRNAVSRALTVNAGAAAVDVPDLPPYLAGDRTSAGAGPSSRRLVEALDAWLDERLDPAEFPAYRDLAGALEAELIRRLLPRYDGKLARVAGALHANRTTLRKRLQGP